MGGCCQMHKGKNKKSPFAVLSVRGLAWKAVAPFKMVTNGNQNRRYTLGEGHWIGFGSIPVNFAIVSGVART